MALLEEVGTEHQDRILWFKSSLKSAHFLRDGPVSWNVQVLMQILVNYLSRILWILGNVGYLVLFPVVSNHLFVFVSRDRFLCCFGA